MSIKKSLRIVLTLCSIVPVVVVSVIAHGLLTDKLVTVQTQNLQVLAETSRNGLEAMLETQKAEVSLLAIQSELQSIATQSADSVKAAPDNANHILQTRVSQYDSCVSISLYDLHMQVIASSDPDLIGADKTDDATLTRLNLTGGIAIGVGGVKTLDQNGQAVKTIEIGCPVYDGAEKSGRLIGYVINTVNLSYFEKFLNATTIGKTGFEILLDQDGIILYHPDTDNIGKPMKSAELSGILTKYKTEHTKTSGTLNYITENKLQAVGYSVIPELDWVLLMKQDISDMQSLTNIIFILLLIICTILLCFIVIFANSLSMKLSAPIIALRDAMRTASDGNLTVQSNIKSKNELGELSKNFNKMLHIIKTNYEDLAAMHEELLSNEEQLRSNYDHIEFLAYHDTLTNLPNKLAFLDYVNAILVSNPPGMVKHAVYFVDLDNFKTVNDTLGHEYGDALLVKTANILTSVLSGRSIIARAGGDEFLIFKDHISSKDDALEFASRLSESFKNPLDLNGEIVYVSMSVGIALYPENGLTPNALIKNADIAMYKSKDTGKNKFTLFDKKMEEELNRNTLIVEILRNAIDSKEVYLQYQPQMELETGLVIGFEALMRIRSSRLGFLSPAEFIPIAEETGLIIELSSWLIKEACSFNKRLIDYGLIPLPVSVNISSIQINRPGFTHLISSILEETGLDPQYLELEITESTLVASIMDATQLLSNLQSLGVRLSLDDFGTGYSSLNYLTKMPINTLKIDKSFIDNICISEKDSFIADTIIQLAHSLNIKVVAEGVEHQNQLALLQQKNCDIIQGFIFSPPLNPSDLVEVLRDNRQ